MMYNNNIYSSLYKKMCNEQIVLLYKKIYSCYMRRYIILIIIGKLLILYNRVYNDNKHLCDT